MTPNRKHLSRGECAQLACLLEVIARKPGNVHPALSFADVTFLDFARAGLAIGPIIEQAPVRGVGRTVLDCVSRCRELVGTNTNLGMILLLAPLAAVPAETELREGVERVLGELTAEDSNYAYQAIRLANPGGLGTAREADVAEEPTIDLRSAMRLAADRDSIARQYANGFEDVFEIGVAALREAVALVGNWEEAIVRCHLVLMSRLPDSLIARKLGAEEARESARRAAEVLERGWPGSESAKQCFYELDRWLRELGNRRNPGSTADLVAASLFVALREGTVKMWA